MLYLYFLLMLFIYNVLRTLKLNTLLLMYLMITQVLSKGHLLGPAGVEVTLSRAGTEDKLQSVVTQPGGK